MTILASSGLWAQQVLAMIAKDIKTEWRTREVFTTTFVFTVLVIVVFHFAMGTNPALLREVAAGVLWVALLFAAVLGLQRAVQIEREEDCLHGVLLAVCDRSALFLAKTFTNAIYLFFVACCTLPLFGIWMHVDLMPQLVALGVIIILGIFGLSALGTLLSLLTANMRMREVLFPLLLLPVSVPLMVAAVYATAKLLKGQPLAEVRDYLTLLSVFDVVFFVVALLVFDYVVEE